MGTQAGTVIILGAGPAGLAAGYALARAGWAVRVYEQASQVGGLARTVEFLDGTKLKGREIRLEIAKS